MEIFDLVDENDHVVGQATRDECHANKNLIHRTVHFTLIDRQAKKIFLTQRSFHKPTDPGKLCFLGEHVLTQESYRDAVFRGAREELGFTPQNYKELSYHIFRFPHQTEFVRFFVVAWNGEEIKYDENEVIKTEWLDTKTLVDNKQHYSDPARLWVESINWDELFSKRS